MSFKLGLAQCAYPAEGDVLVQVEGYAARAERAGVSLLAFPESLMNPPGMLGDGLQSLAEPLDGPYVRGIGQAAARHGLWIAFTMLEANPAGGQPYNTAVVVDDAGAVRGSYRKCHLYDAHGTYESERYTAGGALAAPVVAPFATLGMGICYDLRFPEAVRGVAEACDLLLYPAAWYEGPHKDAHWQTLLRARAIENECFVAGVCRVGGHLVQHSLVASPLGEVVAEASAGECLLVAEIDPTAVAAARAAMPVFAHRRPALY